MIRDGPNINIHDGLLSTESEVDQNAISFTWR